MPDLSPLRQAVSALRPLFKTQGHDPHPNWGDEGHDPDPQLGVWFTSQGYMPESHSGAPKRPPITSRSDCNKHYYGGLKRLQFFLPAVENHRLEHLVGAAGPEQECWNHSRNSL